MFGLLALVLGMGGQTYAKYYTDSAAPAQTATVAKWGFVANANATGFLPATGDAQAEAVIQNGDVVVRADGTEVVSPGNSGSMTFGVTGTAEVSATISYVATGSEICLTKTADSSKYYPLVWTLKNGADVVDVNGASTDPYRLADILSYLSSASATRTLNANTTSTDAYTLSWEWPFSIDEDTDEKDTLLGQIAHSGTVTGYTADLTMSFGVTVKVEQAD